VRPAAGRHSRDLAAPDRYVAGDGRSVGGKGLAHRVVRPGQDDLEGDLAARVDEDRGAAVREQSQPAVRLAGGGDDEQDRGLAALV
jgi:hypothetical protein